MNRQTHIQEITTLQRRYEAKYFPKVKKAIQAEVDHVAGLVQHQGIQSAIRYVSEHLHSKEITGVIIELYKEVGGRFARKTWIGLQSQRRNARKSVSQEIEIKGFGFNAEWVQWIVDFLKMYLIEKITFAVASTTQDALMFVLSKSINEGWGVDKTVEALSELPLSATQAARIVRTEITRAANAGVYSAGQTFDFEQTKEWMAAHDMRTRGQHPNDHASHIGLDGVTIDYEDYFIDPRNGDKLLFPGDPNGSAASVINCRCNIALVAKLDKDGRLIPKGQTVSKNYNTTFIEIQKKMEQQTRDILSELKSEMALIKDNMNKPDLSLIEKRIGILERENDRIGELAELIKADNNSELINELNKSNKTIIETVNQLSEKVSVKEEINNLVDAIQGIEVNPIVNTVEKVINTDNLNESINQAREEIINKVGDVLNEVKATRKDVNKKRNYVLTPKRGRDDLITEVTANQI